MTAREILVDKLHPRHHSQDFSPRLMAIVGGILGQDWVRAPHGELLTHFTITSDGYFLSQSCFLGTAAETLDNIGLLLEAADLDDLDRVAWSIAYRDHVLDWQPGGNAWSRS